MIFNFSETHYRITAVQPYSTEALPLHWEVHNLEFRHSALEEFFRWRLPSFVLTLAVARIGEVKADEKFIQKSARKSTMART